MLIVSSSGAGVCVATTDNNLLSDGNGLTSIEVLDNDTDIDGDAITWNCEFDNTIDGSVPGAT